MIWERARSFAEGSRMHSEVDKLRMQYLFHSAKVTIVMEPFKL